MVIWLARAAGSARFCSLFNGAVLISESEVRVLLGEPIAPEGANPTSLAVYGRRDGSCPGSGPERTVWSGDAATGGWHRRSRFAPERAGPPNESGGDSSVPDAGRLSNSLPAGESTDPGASVTQLKPDWSSSRQRHAESRVTVRVRLRLATISGARVTLLRSAVLCGPVEYESRMG